jgi:hypothetical protein
VTMRTVLFSAVVLTSLIACAANAPTPEQSVAVACITYTEILRSLTVRKKRGTLNSYEIARVDELNAIATPVCTAEDPPAGSARLIDSILLELERILVEKEV